MYLSKLIFIPSMQGEDIGRFSASNVYSQHQWLWRCFDAQENSKLNKADFLFRVDIFSHGLVIYLQSKRMPKQQIEGWSVATELLDLAFKPDDLVQFSLRANPTITKKLNGKPKRHDVLMHAKQQAKAGAEANVFDVVQQAGVDWLLKRQSTLGVAFLENTVEFTNYQQHVLSNGSISYSSVDYQGVLKVSDAVLFSEAVSRGIGKAKAFGCGLMLIRRLS